MDAVRRFLGGEEDRSIMYIPSPVFDDRRPTTWYRTDVTKAGQVNIPVYEREQDFGSDIEPGDHYHVHCFPPSLEEERVKANQYVRFDATVTADHYLTIPKELREEHDIRHEDTVAVHLYWDGDVNGI